MIKLNSTHLSAPKEIFPEVGEIFLVVISGEIFLEEKSGEVFLVFRSVELPELRRIGMGVS